jgi:zinc transport system permease protein
VIWTADFVLRALAAAVGVALVAGPLGCFVAWRRMAYFGTSLAHTALLGIALGLVLGVDVSLGIAGSSIVVALALVALQHQRRLADDTLLGLLAHAGLALGLLALAFLEGVRVDLLGYLFGDVLAVGPGDLAWIYAGGAATLVGLVALWRPLLAAAVHEELAAAEGVPVLPARLAFMLMLAVVIAIAMKIVGVLLITSLLIVPAAAARALARTPEQMAAMAAGAGVVAAVGGLAASVAWDLPAGPAIVAAATGLFLLSLVLGRLVGEPG